MTVLTFPRMHQSAGAAALPGTWKLAAGRAITLRPATAGVLRVAHGQLWVTFDGPHGETPDDAGDLLVTVGRPVTVRPGQRVVMEAWRGGESAYFSWDPVTEAAPVRTISFSVVLQPLADLRMALGLGFGAAGRLVVGVGRLIAQVVSPRPAARAADACCAQGAMG